MGDHKRLWRSDVPLWDHPIMPHTLRAADVYVDAAHEGRHSAAAIEALAVGCPLVAAARSANVALFAGEQAVTLFDVGNVENLRRALHAHVTSVTKNLTRQDALRLVARLETKFSPTAYALKLMDLYRSLWAVE